VHQRDTLTPARGIRSYPLECVTRVAQTFLTVHSGKVQVTGVEHLPLSSAQEHVQAWHRFL
jgi:hypothetical protein